jgi:hypothetical protein
MELGGGHTDGDSPSSWAISMPKLELPIPKIDFGMPHIDVTIPVLPLVKDVVPDVAITVQSWDTTPSPTARDDLSYAAAALSRSWVLREVSQTVADVLRNALEAVRAPTVDFVAGLTFKWTSVIPKVRPSLGGYRWSGWAETVSAREWRRISRLLSRAQELLDGIWQFADQAATAFRKRVSRLRSTLSAALLLARTAVGRRVRVLADLCRGRRAMHRFDFRGRSHFLRSGDGHGRRTRRVSRHALASEGRFSNAHRQVVLVA